MQRSAPGPRPRRPTCHTFQDIFASWLVQRGVSLQELQQLLGHSDPRMTQKYAKLAPGAVADEVAGVLDALSRERPGEKAHKQFNPKFHNHIPVTARPETLCRRTMRGGQEKKFTDNVSNVHGTARAAIAALAKLYLTRVVKLLIGQGRHNPR